MGHIKAYCDQLIALNQTDWQYISSRFESVCFSKGDLLTKQGHIEQFLYFVENGIIRYFLMDNDREQTLNFCFSKEFASAYDSFLTQTPSAYQLQALSDTMAWRISYNDLQNVYAETQVGNTIGRLAAEKLFSAKSKRELSLLKLTARERYLNLFTEQPSVIKNIPLKYVASYIGITPQALSRIRKAIC